MTFDHDFDWSFFTLFSSFLKNRGKKKRRMNHWMIKNLDQKSCLSDWSSIALQHCPIQNSTFCDAIVWNLINQLAVQYINKSVTVRINLKKMAVPVWYNLIYNSDIMTVRNINKGKIIKKCLFLISKRTIETSKNSSGSGSERWFNLFGEKKFIKS